MAPERSLSRLLASIAPTRHEGVYLFSEVPNDTLPEGVDPLMSFREGCTTTLVLQQQQAVAAGLTGECPSTWITLGASSDLAAVGFLAVITARLAAESISVNVVSGYRHDHLFVPIEMAEDAMTVLSNLAESHLPTMPMPLRGDGHAGQTVEIRPALVEEAKELSALWERSGLCFTSQDVISEIQACLRVHPELLLVAVQDATIAGSVWATYDGRRGFVQRLATAPDYRGQGIANALLAEAERRLAHLGAKKVNLLIEPDNAAVARFYRKVGYQSDELLFMERFLPPNPIASD